MFHPTQSFLWAYFKYLVNRFLIALIFCLSHFISSSQSLPDTTPLSTSKQALEFLATQSGLQQSNHWPHIQPGPFLRNLRQNIDSPLIIYAGRSTNFCAYAAVSFFPLHEDPLGYARFMIKMYKEGKAVYGKAYFEPTGGIKQAAGRLTFKGKLDVHPADQVWFLLLADHFKGYLNILDHEFNMGDENKLWAAANYNKFNRMLRILFNYKVDAVGSDLFKPGIRDIYEYLSDRLATGRVALFVNSLSLYKKSHATIRFGVPTHYIVLLNIEEMPDGNLAITYWDYGGRSLQIVSPSFLKKITFGVTHITKKTTNDR